MHEFKKLLNISAKIGNDFSLVQGAGGNTSLKEDGLLHVKASGKWLSRALQESIFVSLHLDGIRQSINNNMSDPVTMNLCANQILRPSIETTLHALLPHRVVLHVHSINTLAHAVRQDGPQELAIKLAGMNWSWVPYRRPGLPLTQAVRQIVDQSPDILILQNHGLVVGGNTCDDAFALLQQVEKRLKIDPRKTKQKPSMELITIAQHHSFKLPFHSSIHSLGQDPEAFKIAQQGVLYPDQTVFLGMKCPVLKRESDIIAFKDKKTPYFLVEKGGVVLNQSASPNVEPMLLCHALLLQKLSSSSALNFLPQEEVRGLMNWEAEKYRQNLNEYKQ